MNKKKKKAFTLIELVIVLAVLAIIALIAIPNFTRVRNNAVIQADNTSEEQITNIIQTAVAEGILVPANGKKYGIKIAANKAISSVAADAGDGTEGGAIPYNLKFGGGSTVVNATNALQDHLRDIEAPQEAGMKSYKINIAGDGRITTTTSNVE